jgi:hypothetical protein
VEANFEDGMLEITLPKMALTQPRKVAVSARKSKAQAAAAVAKEGMEHGQKKAEEQGGRQK